VLKPEPGALQQADERRIGSESRRDCMRLLIAYNARDIDDVKAALLGKRCERLRDRLGRYLRGQG
jgi:hypothetical protein